HALEVLDRHRRRGICPDDQIDGAHDNVTRLGVATGVVGQDLLADRSRDRHDPSVTLSEAKECAVRWRSQQILRFAQDYVRTRHRDRRMNSRKQQRSTDQSTLPLSGYSAY